MTTYLKGPRGREPTVLGKLLGSKKFVTALIAVAVAFAAKMLMPETGMAEILAMTSPLLVYVGAQGVADMGKERAKP